VSEAAPVGTIVSFGGGDTPKGWLRCDGASYRADDFPALWDAIATTWGGDADAKTFNVPDLAGVFLRGVDTDAKRDRDASRRTAMATGGNAGALVGSMQSDEFRRHTHTVIDHGHSHGYNWLTRTGGPDVAAGSHCARFEDNRYATAASVTGITIDSEGGSETRPVNAYVAFIIKADLKG
jgi:microcystin-dependent protein